MENLYPLIGGAERSVDALIRSIATQKDISSSYLCSANAEEQDANEVFASHDIIITQLNWAKKVIEGARLHGKKTVQFVRSLEGFCGVAADCFAVSHCGQRCEGCFYRLRGEELAVPDVLVANSSYTQAMLREQYGLESEIIFPFIEAEQVRAKEREPKYIVMNQFAYHKGADIFLSIAEAMPDLPFRIVGSKGWMPGHSVPKNVEVLGPVESDEIYREALIFLGPSRISESFGRCIVEAQMNGIPVIASDRGGPRADNLVSADYRIGEIDEIELWVEKIRDVLSRYDDVAEEVDNKDFSFCSVERGVKSFVEILRRLNGEPQLASNYEKKNPGVTLGV